MSRRKRYTRNLGRKLREPAPFTTEWVRFEHANEPWGVFCYLKDACRKLPGRSSAELILLRDWFNRHLNAPSKRELGEARFWFRAEAAEHVGRARRLAALVTRAGFPIVEKAERGLRGQVLWSDDRQQAVLLSPFHRRSVATAMHDGH